jgi:hypothetical protein
MTRPAAGAPVVRAIDRASPRLIDRNLASGKYQIADGEIQKLCSTCKEYWPADSEFFYSNKVKNGDGLWYQCKACYLAKRYPTPRVGTPHHDLY